MTTSRNAAQCDVSPTPDDLRKARQQFKLTQYQAAWLVHAAARTWQDWEAGKAKMHPGLWELFLSKTSVPASTIAPKLPPC